MFKRFLIFVIAPVVIVIMAIVGLYKSGLPYENERQLSSLISDNVLLTRSQFGELKIAAESDSDAFFAMGYAHAQDRLWQLELQKRTAQGRLSEILGKGAFEFDVFLRTLDLYRNSKQSLERLSPEARISLVAYANGVNAYINSHDKFPVEFDLVGVQPSLWSPADSLAWIKVFALNSAGNFKEEINKYLIRSILSTSEESALNTLSDDRLRVSKQYINSLFKVSNYGSRLKTEALFNSDFVGSNAWVVSSSLSMTGNSILANDPHLSLQIPSPWYYVDIKANNLNVSGMSMVGLPIVIVGTNQHISWGVTNMMADTQDIYFEQLNPNNPDQYLHDDNWLDFTHRVEIFDIKPDFPSLLRSEYKPVKIMIRETLNGPIISDLVSAINAPIALKWTGFGIYDTSYDAFFKLNYSENWEDFNRSLEFLNAPVLNFLYADTNGNIGYKGAGKIPVRKMGDGMYPLSGWDSDNSWNSFIPFEHLPSKYNPESGYIVSANNNMLENDYPYFISDSWASPARSNRIAQLIEEFTSNHNRIDLAQNLKMQLDDVDLSAFDISPLLVNTRTNKTSLNEALERVRKWDKRASPDSIAATIYYLWLHHLKRELLRDELVRYRNSMTSFSFDEIIEKELDLEKLASILGGKDQTVCDNVSTQVVETCNDILEASLKLTVEELTSYFDSNMEKWKWGEFSCAKFIHQPLSYVRGFDSIFGREVCMGGSNNTVNAIGLSYSEGEGFLSSFGTSFRLVVEMDRLPKLHFVNSSGQSGNVFSAHYADMLDLYAKGDVVTPSTKREQVTEILVRAED